MRSRQRFIWYLGATAILSSPSHAEDAGLRDFPATLVVDEPQVETEVSPQISNWAFSDRTRRDISSELSLQLTRPFAVILSPGYTAFRSGRGGFQDFGTGLKYQFIADAEHETVFSAGVSATFGNTGSALVGAESYTSVAPTVYYGKGAGDLPTVVSWAKPLALTGEAAIEIPTRSRSRENDFSFGGGDIALNSTFLRLQGSIQYNFGYAVANQLLGQWSKPFSALVPIVEYEVEIPVTHVSGPPLGTINPGFLLIDEERHVTWGLEALLPINRASGNHPGARLQLSYSFSPPWHLAGAAPR